MAAQESPQEGEEQELMRKEIFDIAAGAVSFHSTDNQIPRIVLAAQAVLVDGMRPGEAAIKYDFPPERVSEAVGRIRDKWATICDERGWVTDTFSLSPTLIELIRKIEHEALEPLRQAVETKRRKRLVAAQKVAEKKPPVYRDKPATKAKADKKAPGGPKSEAKTLPASKSKIEPKK